ncbi:MAG: ferredoxin [Leptonema sp. (in: Bacteria)]|nr:ferredoxin [Leptonema sp. (in: bacteria)]
MAERFVSVDKDACTSCDACVDNLPKYFQLDDDDLSETHNNGQNINRATVPEEDWEDVQQEIDDCPGEAIHWLKK